MDNTAIRAEFDNVIAKITDPQTIAELEVCREFFTNADFKAKLEQFTWEVSQ